MTLRQIVEAYAHINELSKSVFPYKTTKDLIRLKKRLKEEFDTVVAMEEALVEKYHGAKSANGAYRFPDDKEREQFVIEYNQMTSQEHEIHLPAVDLSKYTGMLCLSPAAMEALEGIVTFEVTERVEGAEAN